MKLRHLVVADPVESVAKHIAQHCDRLAEERVIALTGEQAITAALTHRPEMMIISLELTRPETLEVVKELRRQVPNTFIVVSFRELAVPTIERLGKHAVDDVFPQPLDFAAIYRAASRRFDIAFRRHERHTVTLDVLRADKVLIGRTVDLSEGGMLMDAIHPLNAADSFLVDLALPDDRPLRVRCHVLGTEGQPPTPVKARIQFDKLRGSEHHRLVDFLAHLGSHGA